METGRERDDKTKGGCRRVYWLDLQGRAKIDKKKVCGKNGRKKKVTHVWGAAGWIGAGLKRRGAVKKVGVSENSCEKSENVGTGKLGKYFT